MDPSDGPEYSQGPIDCSGVIDPEIGAHRLTNSQRNGDLTSERDCYEFEVFGQETDKIESARKWRGCTKNPGHPDFIPMREFRMQHLPEDCQREEVVRMVKHASELTVRLRVGDADPSRPEQWALPRGDKCTGTGTIVGITSATGSCSCGLCKEEPHQGMRRWWWLDVLTANHVVYSTQEARFTQVDLFYDDIDSRTDGRMKTCWGVSVVDDYSTGDWSYVQCSLHDENIAEALMRSLKRFERAERDVRAMTKTSSFWSTVVVISHPHGMPKTVTVGDVTKIKTLNSEKDVIPGPYICSGEIRYTADTCKGSSGALVLWLGIELSHTSKSPASKENCIKMICSIFLLYCHMLMFYKDYVAWAVVIFLLSAAVGYLCSLIPELETACIIFAVVVPGITAGIFLWSLMLHALRGSKTFFRVCRGKRTLYSIHFLRHLFTSTPSIHYSLLVFDFGSTLVINLLQLLFLLQFVLIRYELDLGSLVPEPETTSITHIVESFQRAYHMPRITAGLFYWSHVVNCAILGIFFVAPLIFIILLYVIFCALRFHLLRDMILRSRMVWFSIFFILVSFSSLLSCFVFGFIIFLFPVGFIVLQIADYTIQLLVSRSCETVHKLFVKCRRKIPYLQTLSFGKGPVLRQWKERLHLRTVNFIHSCGDVSDNYSKICIGRSRPV